MARRRKDESRVGIASRGIVARLRRFPSRVRAYGGPSVRLCRALPAIAAPTIFEAESAPVKRRYWSFVLRHEPAARSVGELLQSGPTPAGAPEVLQHAPEAYQGIEVVPPGGREPRPPQRFVPVCQRRRERLRLVEAPAVGAQDDRCPGVAPAGPPV